MPKVLKFLAFLDNQYSNAKIKSYPFSFEKSLSSKEVSVEPLTEKINFVVVEKYQFQEVDVNSITFLANSYSQKAEATKKDMQ